MRYGRKNVSFVSINGGLEWDEVVKFDFDIYYDRVSTTRACIGGRVLASCMGLRAVRVVRECMAMPTTAAHGVIHTGPLRLWGEQLS